MGSVKKTQQADIFIRPVKVIIKSESLEQFVNDHFSEGLNTDFSIFYVRISLLLETSFFCFPALPLN